VRFAKSTLAMAVTGLSLILAAGGIVRFIWGRPGPRTAFFVAPAQAAEKPKALLINSYHEGYPWSDGIVDGVLAVLEIHQLKDGQLDISASRVRLRVDYMDTKGNGAEAFKRHAGARVKDLIEAWKPDAVISSDDNAVAYVIVPYFRNTRLPFVFCGINWAAPAYGLPCENLTDMVDVAYIPKMMDALRPSAHGSRVGLLGGRNETN
jgi:hypothetical protein